MSADRSRESGDTTQPNGQVDPIDPSRTSHTADTTDTAADGTDTAADATDAAADGTDTIDTTDTTSGETSTMSHDDSTSAAPQFSDPLADPPTPAPASDPDATTTIPATSTRALPTPVSAPGPFRVEPAAPVPDDVVNDATQLPHLPPPSQPDPAHASPWAAPAGAQPGQQDPRPALVTVRKGPRPGSIMFGLLTMIVAGWLLAANLTDADLTFRLVGPPMVGAFGAMLLVVGLAGVVAGRLRR